ncbi:MAG: thioesterase family protein [Bryobacteraceae bacterium]|jgi:acyl-CoA thioester hydrolase
MPDTLRSHETRFRVRYAETDQMGVVYYANYLIWMELGRAEYCRAAGFRYRDMEAGDGVLLAVVEAHCRYLHPARYDEEIAVKTWVAKANLRMVLFEYEIREAGSGRALASGATKHMFLGPDMRPVKLPKKYLPAFGITSAPAAQT